MRIGRKTGGPGDGVSYRGSHGQTVRVGRSEILYIMSIIYIIIYIHTRFITKIFFCSCLKLKSFKS